VQEPLAGRADRIKACTIAVDVLDRDPSFDPLADPVVRIEAGRLRRCLEHYYLAEGAADRIRITIPKGGYVPQFIVTEEAGSLKPWVMPTSRMRDNWPESFQPKRLPIRLLR
jgi:adenylate cyclase